MEFKLEGYDFLEIEELEEVNGGDLAGDIGEWLGGLAGKAFRNAGYNDILNEYCKYKYGVSYATYCKVTRKC